MLTWLVPHKTAAVSAQVLCTPYSHVLCHFMQSHICKVYASLAVTCHLHFWQNDRDLLRATAVTWGWNGYRNKSQHRKSTLEKKILPPLLQAFEPATFHSRVRRSNPALSYPRHARANHGLVYTVMHAAVSCRDLFENSENFTVKLAVCHASLSQLGISGRVFPEKAAATASPQPACYNYS